MRHRLGILFLALLFLGGASAYCETENEAHLFFSEGNAYYSEEKFEEAIASYKRALNMGYESGALYYNLGNAYFKGGFLGKAILNFLRAKKLMPEDADLNSNLNYARSLVKSGVAEPQRNLFARVFFALAGLFSLDRVTVVSSSLYFMLAVSLIFSITAKRLKKPLFYVNIALFASLVIFISFFAAQYHREFYQTQAVVIARQTDCKFEPFIGGTTFFTLHEGEDVHVVTSKKDWLKVKRADGKQGWVKRSDLEFL